MENKKALIKSIKTFKTSLPMMAGILMLVNLINPIFQQYYPKIFTGNYLIDPFLGAVGGSFAFGIPVTSYVIGGELLEKEVSLLAVLAFIMAWTTVGSLMLPLEIHLLGRKFALWRNGINFVFAIVIAILTIITVRII